MNLTEIKNGLITVTQSVLGWKVEGNDELVRDDGLRLWFREGGYGNEGRITISFNRPRNAKGDYVTLWQPKGSGRVADPSITVAADKASEKIAKDIYRRLLAEAEVVFGLAKAKIASEDDYEARKIQSINKLAEICGGQPERHYQSKELTGEIDPFKCVGIESFKDKGYGRFKVSSGDCITLELTSMNFETAAAVAVAIRNVLNPKK